METETTEDASKRRGHVRMLGWIFVGLGCLQLIRGDWLYGAFLLTYSVLVLLTDVVERLPKVAKYLIYAAFAVFAVFVFVEMVADLARSK
jgi:hypothetical protein